MQILVFYQCAFNFFYLLCPEYALPTLKENKIKDTHRETAPSNKAAALRKSTNMGVWAVSTLNQLFIRGS